MCNKSESIAKIAAALVAFSGEVKSIEKDATNPHFKSAYTTLDHMIDETKPLLHKHGLTVMQFPGGDGQKVTIRTMILHTSGEWIETEPLTLHAVKMDPQGAGSAITYARRYSYAAALSLSLGDDDDGNASSQPPQARQNTPSQQNYQQAQQRAQAPTGQSSASSNAISPKQIGLIKKLKMEKRISDDAYYNMLKVNYGVTSGSELTVSQASKFIDQLEKYESEPEPAEQEALPF